MEASGPERAALTDDLRKMALAHAALDELAVPRFSDSSERLSLFGRIMALRAGRFDPRRLRIPVHQAER
jgi:hypothetical protein